MVETDDTPRRRYRKASGIAALPKLTVRLRPAIDDALARRARTTGRTKNEIIETAVARALGVKE